MIEATIAEKKKSLCTDRSRNNFGLQCRGILQNKKLAPYHFSDPTASGDPSVLVFWFLHPGRGLCRKSPSADAHRLEYLSRTVNRPFLVRPPIS